MPSELQVKQEIVKMLSEGYVLAPCANTECENLFASGTYCVGCDE
jgi:hypothetical protein